MALEREDKIVVVATHGPEDPERATLPFVMATAAQTMDTAAVVILQGGGVLLAEKNIMDYVFAGGLPPLRDLMKTFLEGGGKLLVCTPCVQHRMIEQSKLVEGAELIAGARVVQESITAAAVLNY
jgi:predicted peroxiredoxin